MSEESDDLPFSRLKMPSPVMQTSLRLVGGAEGNRDALESATAMSIAPFGGSFLHHDIFAMAPAYAHNIAENQPSDDGKARTALNATLVPQATRIALPGDGRHRCRDRQQARLSRPARSTGNPVAGLRTWSVRAAVTQRASPQSPWASLRLFD